MKIIKGIVRFVVFVAVVVLAVNGYILRQEVDKLHEQIKAERDTDQILKVINEERVELAGFAAELKAFEKQAAEKDEELSMAVGKLEEWVETSSVQGKWNGYKRQLGDYEERMKEKYRQEKESLQMKIDAMKLKLQKIKEAISD